MNTTHWGPLGWGFLFSVAMGYDYNETPKHEKDVEYREFFRTIGHTLPCKYCRDSYVYFFEEVLDIDAFMEAKELGLVHFVYEFKDLVNQKLMQQEAKALAKAFQSLTMSGKSGEELWDAMREVSRKTCVTKPSPPFAAVVAELRTHRAGCNKGLKACREPL